MARGALFPDYDLERQARVQNSLAGSRVPVAGPVVFEADASYPGGPFLVIPRVAGRTLTALPRYVKHGWLHEAGPDVQRTVLRHFLSALAAIH
ncbi:MAG: phosphotransferase [Mycobacteriales bacterium]